MPKITYIEQDGTERTVDAEIGASVMETAINNDIPGILATCGGSCSCATCHVYVDPGWLARLPAMMSDERELLSELTHYRENSRLSCQVEFTPELAGLRVQIAPDE